MAFHFLKPEPETREKQIQFLLGYESLQTTEQHPRLQAAAQKRR